MSTAPAQLQVSLGINPSFAGSSIERQSWREGEGRGIEKEEHWRTLGFGTKTKRPTNNHHSGKLIASLQGYLANEQPGQKIGLPSHPESGRWGGDWGEKSGMLTAGLGTLSNSAQELDRNEGTRTEHTGVLIYYKIIYAFCIK